MSQQAREYLAKTDHKLLEQIDTAMQNTQHNTVKDALELIYANATSGVPELETHAQTLLGPRKRGSTTELGLEDANMDAQLHLISDPCVDSPCKAYRAHCPELKGIVRAGRLIDALGRSKGVITRQGEHGPELVAIEPEPLWEQDVNDRAEWIYFIVGEFAGQTAVFTWHPGPPLRPYEPDKALTPQTAVKLH